ncbi:hypothetical protein, partial [Mycobacterium sp. 852013-50091_SCH5140682]|uniref:hypothetical protein n=1 Tax=Mycobacterium sp. 852013-50091_SCH5140682 TaxID=1834109 RepID=UPI001E4420FD
AQSSTVITLQSEGCSLFDRNYLLTFRPEPTVSACLVSSIVAEPILWDRSTDVGKAAALVHTMAER